MIDYELKWDIFISYASEDQDLAVPLNEMLVNLGMKVWFDKSELNVGDSLRERIDEGLSKCRYGVVILSHHFFNKRYPQRELNGLAQREIDGGKFLLPIWKNISAQEVCKYSPPLADKIALLHEDGLLAIVEAIIKVVRPDLLEIILKKAKEYTPMFLTESGIQLINLIRSSQTINHVHEELSDSSEIKSVGGFLDGIIDLIDCLDLYSAEQEAQLILDLTEELRLLKANNWQVYICQRERYYKMTLDSDSKATKLKELSIAVVRSDCRGVTIHKDNFMIETPDDRRR